VNEAPILEFVDEVLSLMFPEKDVKASVAENKNRLGFEHHRVATKCYS
jgi:hypothetical protein